MHGVQGTLDELGTALSAVTFCVVDLETTGGCPAAAHDHRDRRGQGARRRGARRVPDPGQPGRADPAVHRGAHRHHRLDGRRRPADRAASCRRSSSSPAAACWSPTTRRSTSASSSTSPPSRATPWPRFEVLDTAKLARRVITRDDAPNCKLSLAGARLRRHDHAQPPGALRRAGHRRRAARADGAARQPRRAHPRGAADLLLPGHAPPSAASGTSPSSCRTPRASTSSATTRGRVLYVGTSRDLRTRVRTYFTASETRSRMGEMVGLADERHAGSSAPPRSRPRSASCG